MAGAIRKAIPRRCRISSSWRKPLARMACRCSDPAELDAAIKEMIETPNTVVLRCARRQDGKLLSDDPVGQGA